VGVAPGVPLPLALITAVQPDNNLRSEGVVRQWMKHVHFTASVCVQCVPTVVPRVTTLCWCLWYQDVGASIWSYPSRLLFDQRDRNVLSGYATPILIVSHQRRRYRSELSVGLLLRQLG
jgi:hypothetical protein